MTIRHDKFHRTGTVAWRCGMNVLCLLLIVGCLSPVSAANPGQLSRSELLKRLKEGYDSRVPPNFEDDRPLGVRCGIYINSFDSIDESSMDYSMSIFLRQAWKDERLAYGHLSNESSISLDSRLLQNIWVTDLYFPNEKRASFHSVTIPNTLIVLHRDGSIWYSTRISLKLACPMSLHKFPLDEQFCSLLMESYAYSMEKLVFRWFAEAAVEIDPALELPQFQLISHRTEELIRNYSTGSFSQLRIMFHLKRDVGFYMIQTYIPSVLIVILSWVGFWINSDAIPARISLGVLTVLTMTTQTSGSTGSLPRVSYIKAIDIWMATCLLFVFAALLEFAVVNVLTRKAVRKSSTIRRKMQVNYVNSDRYQDIPLTECNSVAESEASADELPPVKDGAATADTISRTGFPLAFVLFNILYWLLYSRMPNHVPA